MIKAGIIGSTGYAGGELTRLLTGHKDVEIIWLGSKNYIDKKYYEVYHNFFKIINNTCSDDDIEKLSREADVIFTATPQGYLSSVLNDSILSETRLIDLSADFRIKDVNIFEKWYELKHKSSKFLKDAVYGLCEINRDEIRNKRLIANPGCYPTCSILSLYPLLKDGLIETESIIIDAKSGTTGAGRSAKSDNLFCEVNENIKPYGVASHRHTPEIEQQLSQAANENVLISFTPHLIPMNKGILITAYAKLKNKVKYNDIRDVYEKYYNEEKFIRLLDEDVFPQTKWVEGSNFTDINFKIDERTNRIVVMGALDNLIKGAAGQAVQNMNIIFGLNEMTGLMQPPLFP